MDFFSPSTKKKTKDFFKTNGRSSLNKTASDLFLGDKKIEQRLLSKQFWTKKWTDPRNSAGEFT